MGWAIKAKRRRFLATCLYLIESGRKDTMALLGPLPLDSLSPKGEVRHCRRGENLSGVFKEHARIDDLLNLFKAQLRRSR